MFISVYHLPAVAARKETPYTEILSTTQIWRHITFQKYTYIYIYVYNIYIYIYVLYIYNIYICIYIEQWNKNEIYIYIYIYVYMLYYIHIYICTSYSKFSPLLISRNSGFLILNRYCEYIYIPCKIYTVISGFQLFIVDLKASRFYISF